VTVVDPEFLELEDVFELHAESIERYGGDSGVRDQGLIESAVAVPRQSFGGEYLHVTLFEMAAAYAFHLAENQGFVDGNKRSGLAAATAFLAMNGYDLIERDDRPRALGPEGNPQAIGRCPGDRQDAAARNVWR
jgi:death-on-curing protein